MRWFFSDSRRLKNRFDQGGFNVVTDPKNKIEPALFATSHLESWQQRRRRLRYIRVLLLKNTVFFLLNAVTLPQTWSYLKWLNNCNEESIALCGVEDQVSVSKWWSSAIVSITPFLRLVTSPFAGWLSDRYGYRSVALTCDLLVCIGAFLWSIAPVSPIKPEWWLFISRALMALCGGQLELLLTYIATATSKEERRKLTAQAATSLGLGTVLGPALLTLFSLFGHNFRDYQNQSIWQLNTFTLSSLTITMFIFLATFLSHITFTESNLARDEIQKLSPTIVCYQDQSITETKNYSRIFICLMTTLHSFGAMRFHETLLVAMTMEIYGWKENKALINAGIILLLTSILSMAVNNLSTRVASRIGDRFVLILGLVCGLSAALFGLPIEKVSDGQTVLTSNGSKVVYSLSIDHRLNNQSEEFFSWRGLENGTTISYPSDYSQVEISSFPSKEQKEVDKEQTSPTKRIGYSEDQDYYLKMSTYLPFSHLTVCVILTGVSCTVLFTSSGALYSQMDHASNHAIHWGLMGSAANLGRAAYPLFFTSLYSKFGSQVTYLALVSALSTLLLLTALVYGRLATNSTINLLHNLKQAPSDDHFTATKQNELNKNNQMQDKHLVVIIESLLRELQDSKHFHLNRVGISSNEIIEVDFTKQLNEQQKNPSKQKKMRHVSLGPRIKHNSSSL